MSPSSKQLSNPYSTGGGGIIFETRVQAMFVALMLTDGFAPCLPPWPIKKIKLQGKYDGYDTDDLIVFVESADGEKRKLLGQIKHLVSINKGDKVFGEVIQAAWNDFNSHGKFTEGMDVIALITGPLSSIDTDNVRTILEWTRDCENASEFIVKVNATNFSSNEKRNKLEAFRVHLNNSNDGNDVSEEKLWRFMKSFHLLGYDLDIKAGATLSLLHSFIGQNRQESADSLWAKLLNEVQSANQNAGTITLESLPKELKDAFTKHVVETIPANLTRPPSAQVPIDWNKEHIASELAFANLIGSWNDKSEADKNIAGELANKGFDEWISTIRDILQQPETPITLKNGTWAIVNRLEMWKTLGSRLFDDDLEKFKKCVVAVLTERDPQFDLVPDERYAASMHGKILTHSDSLRSGLAETLALLGGHPDVLTNCSPNKAEGTAVVAIRELLNEADWVLWGSLNSLLPMLSEADPNEFLKAVENALTKTPCPFDELFSQEGKGTFGRNHITGLLWALESLAWDGEYLPRVTVILGELASHDPGGSWANRPSNSLTTIFLPWSPQTTAPIPKRKVAIQTLQKEVPDVGWKLLLSLLPNQHQMTMGSHKPVWRGTIPEDWPREVTKGEYWDQISFYGDMAVHATQNDFFKLIQLIGHLGNLPQPAFDALLTHLGSDEIISQPEDARLPIWTKLVEFASKHKKYAGAKWAFDPDIIEKIDTIADRLAPKTLINIYQRLFNGRDSDLHEEKSDWENQRKKLEERRQNAILQIIAAGGLDDVVKLSKVVESPWQVGLSLGIVVAKNVDSAILPDRLESRDIRHNHFVSGFVWGRYHSKGWAWVDQVDSSKWSLSQKGQFLVYLPFTEETWKRSELLLKKHEVEYWSRANVNPYGSEGDLNFPIGKLIQYGRPNETISCIHKILDDKKPLDNAQTVKALLDAVSSSEPANTMDAHYTIEIIKALQNAPETNQDDLARVEFAYLPLLDRYQGASPKLLEQRLASDPNFFCEVIRLVYRSKNEGKSDKEPTRQQKAIGENAFRLLHNWQTPPGLQLDGNFSKEHFSQWLASIKTSCLESGHLDVAFRHLGNVLIHCPPDSDGLWIKHAVAEALNARDAEEMRSGFRMGLFNTRGVHWVDPTGKPEKELAAKYRQQALDVENHSYQRLAVTLRELADSYDREASSRS